MKMLSLVTLFLILTNVAAIQLKARMEEFQHSAASNLSRYLNEACPLNSHNQSNIMTHANAPEKDFAACPAVDGCDRVYRILRYATDSNSQIAINPADLALAYTYYLRCQNRPYAILPSVSPNDYAPQVADNLINGLAPHQASIAIAATMGISILCALMLRNSEGAALALVTSLFGTGSLLVLLRRNDSYDILKRYNINFDVLQASEGLIGSLTHDKTSIAATTAIGLSIFCAFMLRNNEGAAIALVTSLLAGASLWLRANAP